MKRGLLIGVFVLSLAGMAAAQSVPGTVNFGTGRSGGIDDDISLMSMANNAHTVLLEPQMGPSDTSCTVVSTTVFPASGALTIDGEICYYTGTTATSFTGLLRGQDGTIAASHEEGAAVHQNLVERNVSVLRDAIIAVENAVLTGGGGGGSSSTFGAAFPSTGTAAGASNGTDMVPLLVDSNGYLEVNVKTGFSIAGLLLSPGTATSGETGPLMQGAVVSSNPSYSNGNTDPLTITPDGFLNVYAGNQTLVGVASGAADAGNNIKMGAVYNATAPILSTGQRADLQTNSHGGLIVDPSAVTSPISAASLPLPSNAAQETGGNLAAIAAPVGATGSAVPSKAAYVGAVSSGNVTGVIQGDTTVSVAVSTATTTQLVALSSGKKIYVTSFSIIAAGTGNIQFEYGTGTNCGTGPAALTGNYNLTAQVGLAQGSGLGPILVVPAGNALCVITSAAVGMAGHVTFTQF
ncbi:MAG TPA: hypothetical protein VI756_08765 [Blastocatellia bacterium]